MLYNPTKNAFPAVSVTGTNCALNCKHCGGIYLKHMIPVTQDSLYDLCMDKHLKGVLISGGSTLTGRVPLDLFLPIIKRIKEEKDLLINVHTGLVTKKDVKALKKAHVDCVSFDFVIDRNILKNVYGLDKTPRDYINSLKILAKHVNVAPHLCIGLNYGRVVKELEALKILSQYPIKKLVLLVLKPTKGTPMENVDVNIEGVCKVLEKAAEFERVALGCMRPRNEKIEKRAYELGFDIAKPSFLKGKSKNVCCVF